MTRLEQLKNRDYKDSTILCHFLGYREYIEEPGNDRVDSNISKDFEYIRQFIQNNASASGGSTECGCEDVEGAIEVAIRKVKHLKKEDYAHVFIIIGDYPAKGCKPGCLCTNRGHHRYTNETYDSRWRIRANELRELNTLVYFLCVKSDLGLTKDKLDQFYDSNKVFRENLTSSSSFVSEFEKLLQQSFVTAMNGIS